MVQVTKSRSAKVVAFTQVLGLINKSIVSFYNVFLKERYTMGHIA